VAERWSGEIVGTVGGLGGFQHYDLVTDGEEPWGDGDFEWLPGRVAGSADRVLVKRAVGGDRAERLLRTEIEVLNGIQRNAPTEAARGVPRGLVYSMAANPPWLLLDWPGEPLGEEPPRVDDTAVREAVAQLFAGLHHLQKLGLVHGGIAPSALRWHPVHGIRIFRLDRIMREGAERRRTDAGVQDWQVPHGGDGDRKARHTADVQSAVLVAFWLATGGERLEPGSGTTAIRRRARAHDQWIMRLVHDAFPETGLPPRAATLLQNRGLAGESAVSAQALTDSAAHDEFAYIRSRQRATRLARAAQAGARQPRWTTTDRRTRPTAPSRPPYPPPGQAAPSRARGVETALSASPPYRPHPSFGRQPLPPYRRRRAIAVVGLLALLAAVTAGLVMVLAV
jgi:hypothetical protein